MQLKYDALKTLKKKMCTMFPAYTFNVFSLKQSVKQSVYDRLNKWQLLLSDQTNQHLALGSNL